MNEDTYKDWAKIGEKHFKEGRFDEAAAVFRYGYSLDPNDVLVLSNLGASLLMTKQNLDEAEEMLRRSIVIIQFGIERVNENEAKTLTMWLFKNHYNLAKVCHQRACQVKQEKQKLLESGVKYRSGKDHTWDSVGDFIEEYDSYLNEAEKAIEMAIELNPDFHKGWMVYGQVQDELGKYSEALSAIDRAIELDNRCGKCWSTKGFIEAHLGDYAAAEVSFRTVLELDNDDADAWWCLGSTLQELGRTDELNEVEKNLKRLGTPAFTSDEIL